MPNPLFDPFQEAMRLAVPLTINERNLAQQEKEKQAALQLMQEKIIRDTLEKAAAHKQEQDKATLELSHKIMTEGIKSQSQGLYDSARGILGATPGGMQIPEQMPGPPVDTKEGNTLEAAIVGIARKENWPPEKLIQTLGVINAQKHPVTNVFGSSPQGIFNKQSGDITAPAPMVSKAPPGYRVLSDGSMEPIPGGPADVTNPKNRPKPPPGYRYSETGDQEIIPGGPADVKTQINMAKDTAARDSMASDLDRLGSSAEELMNHPGLDAITGVLGSRTPNLTDNARNAAAKLDKLKSQVGFTVLQNMRNNSKTGGALGNVSDNEGKRLENNLAALDRAQSYEEYKKELANIVNYVKEAKARVSHAWAMQWGNEKKVVTEGVKSADDFLKSLETK